MYKIIQSGYEVLWNPENLQIAQEVMSEELNKTIDEIESNAPILVDLETANNIRNRYDERIGVIDAAQEPIQPTLESRVEALEDVLLTIL